jgi:multiple sugar transport system substrate-binding protein
VPLLPLLLAAAGCGRTDTGPVEIVYWTGWSGHELAVQRKLVDRFNQTHPQIRVRLLSQFGNSGYQKVRIAFAGGATPDVMSTVWADELASYALRGVLTPLDGWMKQSGRNLEKEFVPGVARALRVNGEVYGLAVTTNTNFILYNRKIFRDAGLDPDRPPQTIRQLDDAADACTKVNPDGTFARYGFRPGSLLMWAYAFGGGWYDVGSKRVTANAPRNVEALRWMASYRKRYDMKRLQAFESTFGSASTPNGPFFVGKMAMWSTGEWSEEFIHRYAPDLDYGFFPIPAPPGGNPGTTVVNGSVFVVPQACAHKREAWTFLNWLTSAENVRTFCASIKNVPPLKAVGEDPSVASTPLLRFAAGLSRSPNARGAPGTPIWPTYTREIDRVEQAAVLDGQDPQVLLDRLQAQMQHDLDELRKELGAG